jgi:hypothetical protein
MEKVKFLKPEQIENASLSLIAQYGHKYGAVDKPPIPAEEILEAYLGLSFDFEDLTATFGLPDVLGATWIQDRRVAVDQSLDPLEYPNKEGRYRFTVAHELGHWELHRHYFLAAAAQRSLFDDEPKPPIVCRTSFRKAPMEWQADNFAGYLLMPGDLVFKAWEVRHGNREPYIAKKEMADLSAKWGLAENQQPTVDIARTLAREFNVSGQAMQIRLIGLGLIKTKEPDPSLFSI